MKVDYIVGDDWQGLYINNKLIDEGHELMTMDVLNHIADKLENSVDGVVTVVTMWSMDQDWIEECGSLPQLFSDIPYNIKGVQDEVSF